MALDIIARGMAGNAAAEAEGKADLVNGKVPAEQLPSYVDDVVEYASVSDFPEVGEAGKIYVALNTNATYRWSGSEYIIIGSAGIPDCPSVDGDYVLRASVVSGVRSYWWETDTVLRTTESAQ